MKPVITGSVICKTEDDVNRTINYYGRLGFFIIAQSMIEITFERLHPTGRIERIVASLPQP
jgi:hypothetical protein